MQSIRSANTEPELAVRRELHKRGFRYKLHDKKLPGNPDIVLPKYKTIVQVHGCFWHAHNCSNGSGKRKPSTNQGYWLPKLSKTIARDKRNLRALRKEDWRIITVWECESKESDRMLKKLKPLLDER